MTSGAARRVVTSRQSARSTIFTSPSLAAAARRMLWHTARSAICPAPNSESARSPSLHRSPPLHVRVAMRWVCAVGVSVAAAEAQQLPSPCPGHPLATHQGCGASPPPPPPVSTPRPPRRPAAPYPIQPTTSIRPFRPALPLSDPGLEELHGKYLLKVGAVRARLPRRNADEVSRREGDEHKLCRRIPGMLFTAGSAIPVSVETE